MRTIKQIFFTDIMNLLKNAFACIIAIGVCFLPALYAWFNIYSNWDPYGNTGSLKLAAVSLDKGYTDESGNYRNISEEIMKDMAASDKIDWNFVDTKEEAIDGVESGEYYAALVIEEEFTYNMYNMFIETDMEPTLVFYQNQKKNPVATKISDTVVGNLETKINEEFIKVMTTTIFSDATKLHADMEENGGVDAFIERLEKLTAELQEYQEIINHIIAGNAVLSRSVSDLSEDAKKLSEKTSNSSVSLANANASMQQSQDTLNTYRVQVNQTVDVMVAMLSDIQRQLQTATLSGNIDEMVEICQRTSDDTNHLINDLDALRDSLEKAGALDPVTTLEELSKQVKEMQDALEKIKPTDTATGVHVAEDQMIKEINAAIVSIEDMRAKMNNQLIPQLNDSIDGLENIMANASDLMINMSGMFNGMGNVFGSLQTTISSADVSLEKTQAALGKISERISKATEKAKTATEDERVKVLINTLTGDPDLYGEFFSEPVEIMSVAVYPIENYGSAVAPFYTTLSIWVGVIILAAVIKVKPRKEKYPQANPTELFFGRGMFFLFMGQIQTLVTVLGDIFLLKIQCIHPFLFWLTTAITSLTFTLLIYALVYTFGDVGKAIAVVVLVLQIAGSSGTYPIELLPEFFQKVYIFFPFPYAINAMRECICGLYEADVVIYLLKLAIFLIPALVVGLLLRIPFEDVNHFMKKRMEDTEMM